MRTGLPNAQFLAFTGTPLLGAKRLTNAWFGDYVSEYNFAESIKDNATVPLYYVKRVPEVELQNDFLDSDFAEILEEENLTDAEQRRLENHYAKELEVIKRDDRLDAIAQHIVYHFPRRGFRGKGMVISVDKFTAVKMYDKVSYYWKEEIKKLNAQITKTEDATEKLRLKDIVDYMRKVEMAVVISEDADEEAKFAAEGLSIKPHRERMNKVDENGFDIEDNFKDPNNPLQLVFVCAMWLTGFDAPSVSTLYLDKPMKGHTLMQTIARANRVYNGKECGLIIDYLDVFKYLKRALADYASDDGGLMPVKDVEKLLGQLHEAIDLAQGLEVDGLGVLLNGALDFRKVVRIHKGGGNAELGQGVGQQVIAAAVDGLLGDNVIARLSQSLNGVGDSRRTGSQSQGRHAALQSCQALFQYILGGVGQTAVDVARIRQAKPRRRMGRIAEYVRRRLINRHRSGIRRGIGLFLTHMQLQGFKTILVLTHDTLLHSGRWIRRCFSSNKEIYFYRYAGFSGPHICQPMYECTLSVFLCSTTASPLPRTFISYPFGWYYNRNFLLCK